MKTISIVGGGFCGCMLTLHLLKKSQTKIKVQLIEKADWLCRGAAYSTEFDFHLLNVRAEHMSAFQHDPDNFINWIKEQKYPYDPEDFVPRKLYGNYISNLLFQEFSRHTNDIDIYTERAVDIILEDDKVFLLLDSGKKLLSDKIILAPGNYIPQSDNDPFQMYLSDGIYFNNPWQHQDFLSKIDKNDDILILGSGLTMIDLCTSLYFNGHKGKIYSLSKTGLLPSVHKPVSHYDSFYEEIEPANSLLEIFSIVKKHIREHQKNGGDWRDVIDSLRPYNQKIWMKLSTKDKAIFMKRLNRMWSISRHRIPVEYQIIINELMQDGQLEILAGKIDRIAKVGRKLNITVREKKSGDLINFAVSRVMNCTGPQLNYLKLDDPLINSLFEKGLIHPGPLNLGVDAFPNCKVKNHYKEDAIYAIGSALTGILFETTAVPEIRVQAEELADVLLFSDVALTEK